ncbi:unnamed protein product [Thelazia callipaeda]|uniref:Equilibrative nucleoside transporter 1 n=1 Tax=Thelazia callipaeda TaxID=103827 RepID=A0A158RCX2_THECL|nr:unnamed protein product [Thelazia callipaeda]
MYGAEENLEEVAMLSKKPPEDKYYAVYLFILLNGIGTLMPWNMFITIAPSYYVNYKFVEVDADGAVHKTDYALHFLSYLGLASQLPTLLLNLTNLFIQIKGGLRRRIGSSLIVLAIITLATLIFTLVDTSKMITTFFIITMVTVVILNAANGIYQNSLYGLTASFPPHYTNALILGNNICGTFVSVMSIITLVEDSDKKEAVASENIITGVELVGSGSEMNKFGEITESQKVLQSSFKAKLKLYFEKGKRCFYCLSLSINFQIKVQCFNVWCVFFVTLTLFPTTMADIRYYSESGKYDFIIPEKLFISITTYLLFNFFAVVGSFLANFVQWPSQKWLIFPVVARIIFIPLMIFCNFRPEYRTWNIWIYNVWIYIALAVVMSITSGYFSSLAMMYAPRALFRIVEPSKSAAAGMIAAFFLMFGITSGIMFTLIVSWFTDSAGPYLPGTFKTMMS